MAIKTDTDKFIKMKNHLDAYLDSKINELQPEYDANSELYTMILAPRPDNTYQPKGDPVWYAKTFKMKTIDEVITYVFDFETYQSNYENFYDEPGILDPVTGEKLNNIKIPICKEIPKLVIRDIAEKMGETGSPTTIEQMIEKTDIVKKYLLYTYAKKISKVYAQLTVDYIIKNYKKEEISNWTVDDIDQIFSFGLNNTITLNGNLANKALETIGREMNFQTRFYGDDSFVVLDDYPWKGNNTLLEVVLDELKLPSTVLKPKQPGELETGVVKPEIVQTDPPKKSGNKAKPDPSKFTITLSRFTRMWEPPREFSDGIPANSDLPEFFFFIGEEQKAAPDQLTNYSDINYEELDEEYIEDSFNVGIEIGTGPDPTMTKLDLSVPVPVYEEGGGSYESGAPAVLGGDADYWSLIACCLLEDGNHPAEVAQCIYNRYGCPRRPYGQTIKGIVIAKNQFEVAFNKNPRTGDPSPAWKAISSRDTAIKAVQYSKGGGDYEDIGTKLDNIEKLLKNSDLQSKALALVGGRTGFRSSNSAMNSQKVSVKQTPAVGTGRNRIPAGNKFFWERGTAGYNHYYLEQTDRATGRKYYNNPAGVPNMMKNSA